MAEQAECIQMFRSVLSKRIHLLNAILAVLMNDPSVKELREETKVIEEPMRLPLYFLIQPIGSSCYTLVTLTDVPGLQTRDCFCIIRSVVECAVNACYVLAEGPKAAEQTRRHFRQKAFRDLERESRIGDQVIRSVFTGKPKPESIKGLEDDLKEFSSKRGREKNWTDLSVEDRIAVAARKFGGEVGIGLQGVFFRSTDIRPRFSMAAFSVRFSF